MTTMDELMLAWAVVASTASFFYIVMEGEE